MGYFLPGANKTPAEYKTELLEAQKRRDLLIAENDAAAIKIGELSAKHREAFTRITPGVPPSLGRFKLSP
jgi:hypothetical protein